jgi:antibiotic biosynthesis monooxygenase (ABM) superfamily enzyme
VTASPQGSSASFVVQYRLRAGASREFSRLFGDLTDSLSTAGGFEGTEVHFDAAGTSPTVVWRFATVDEARTWSKSATMETFERSLEPYSVSAPVHNVILNAGRSGAASTVITTRVKPGSDSWFADWQGRMGAAQQQFPGYVGQRVQAPVPGVNADWVAIVAFDSPEDLRVWTDSPERQALVTESEPYVERYYVRPADSAFESWFAKSDAGGKPPPGWKLSAIVLLVLYPIVMLEFFTLNHLTVDVLHLNPALGVFIGNAISVAITGFLLIPWASKLLNWWLVPPEVDASRRTRQGTLVVLGLYAISVIVFWVVVARFPQLMP